MLTVTEAAINRFAQTLNEHAKDTDALIRMVVSDDKENRLEFVLEEEKDGDQVVEAKDGRKILAVDGTLSRKLEGMILDFQDKPDGDGFTIYRVASDS